MRVPHLAIALDTSDWSEFEEWCDRFGPRAEVLKIGLEAYVRWGPAAVERARDSGAEIFLDLKLHDIPNTVAGAVGSAADLGVGYLTVHASGGARMLEAAVVAAGGRVRILAVDSYRRPGARAARHGRLSGFTSLALGSAVPIERLRGHRVLSSRGRGAAPAAGAALHPRHAGDSPRPTVPG
jgi:orotidine-5'-phosphate decarboxylase